MSRLVWANQKGGLFISSCYSDLGKTGKNGWKRYLLSIFIIVAVYFVVGILLLVSFEATLAGIASIAPYAHYVQINLSFIALWLALFLSITIIHQRSFLTLITHKNRINWRIILYSFTLYFILTILATLVEYLIHPKDFIFSLDYNQFIIFLLLALILTPIQATAEELLFRGYVMQSLGLITRNNIVLVIISSTIFALAHLGNPELSNNFFAFMGQYFAIGILLSLVTLKSNSLEIAIGAHIANNIFSASIVSYEGSALETNSIFFISDIYPVFQLVEYVIFAVVFYLLISRYVVKTNDYKCPEN